MTTRLTRTELRTNPELLALIEKAKAHVMTPEEVEAQRISWVIGQIGMTHPEWAREETEARVREALRLPPAPHRWRHVKTGGTYVEVGRGRMQTGAPLPDMAEVVVYRSEKDGSLWARPVAEFEDGRFTALSSSRDVASEGRGEAAAQAPWRDVMRENIGRFEVAAAVSGSAVWNAEGSAAMAKLLKEMCKIIDDEINARAAHPAEAEVARLREWCSAAADDLDGLLATMKAGVGTRFDDIFRRAAEEFTKTSAFLRAAAEGRADGTLYEAELTKAKNERDTARAAVAQMREDCARAAERFAPATSGPDYGMASEAERRDARKAESLAYDIAVAVRALPTAGCPLPTAELP